MRKKIVFGINIAIFIATLYGVLYAFIFKGRDISATGFEQFKFFTVLSNIFSGVACLLNAIMFYNKPKWLKIVTLASTTAVMVTFMTVMCFLGVIYGYSQMFTGANIFFHLINPLLALVAYIFGYDYKIEYKNILYSMIFVGLYGAVYVINVLVTKVWDDFYGFTTAMPWPVAIIAMLVSSFAISNVIYFSNNLFINLNSSK